VGYGTLTEKLSISVTLTGADVKKFKEIKNYDGVRSNAEAVRITINHRYNCLHKVGEV
jgi:hypothetical protein